MPAKPTVDVLMPFHRVDNFLTLSVKSLLSSVGVQIRLVAINDLRSDDLSFPIDDERIYVTNSSGNGYRDAIKHGLKYLESDFVAFQDSDDLSDPNRLIGQINLLIETNADISNCLMTRIDESGRATLLQPPDLSTNQDKVIPFLLGSYGANSTWVFRRELLSRREVFNFDSESLDWNSALKNFSSIKINTLPESLYFYRNHEQQMTKSAAYNQSIAEAIYPAWRDLNNSLDLPNLNKSKFTAVCFPPSDAKWDAEVSFWARNLLKSEKIHKHDKRAINQVLGVRANKKFLRKQMSYFSLLEVKLLFLGIFFVGKQLTNAIFLRLQNHLRNHSVG